MDKSSLGQTPGVSERSSIAMFPKLFLPATPSKTMWKEDPTCATGTCPISTLVNYCIIFFSWPFTTKATFLIGKKMRAFYKHTIKVCVSFHWLCPGTFEPSKHTWPNRRISLQFRKQGIRQSSRPLRVRANCLKQIIVVVRPVPCTSCCRHPRTSSRSSWALGLQKPVGCKRSTHLHQTRTCASKTWRYM